MFCEKCNIEHDGSYGSGRFCSMKCSRGFSGSKSKGSKRIIKNAHKHIEKKCRYCNNFFVVNYNKRLQECCSNSCATLLKGGWKVAHNKLSKEDWSKINKLSYANGNNFVAGGTTKWHTYKDIKVQGSYELRVCKILDNWKDSNKIKTWEYTKDRIKYINTDNKESSYLLDFKVFALDNSFYYLETKGWKKPNDDLKWKAVRDKGFKLIVWFNEDITKEENFLKIIKQV